MRTAMQISNGHKLFLRGVGRFNGQFNVVRLGNLTEPLRHSFWNSKEIEDSHRVKADWGIPLDLIPFYGDWHDVICLNARSGEIILLNDARQTRHNWHSPVDFVASLIQAQDWSVNTRVSVVEEWLDPDLK
ncbi:MAG: cell wall assembly protein [Gemmataceae bacterium]